MCLILSLSIIAFNRLYKSRKYKPWQRGHWIDREKVRYFSFSPNWNTFQHKTGQKACYTCQLLKSRWSFPTEMSSMYEKWSCMVLNRYGLWYLMRCDIIKFKTLKIYIHEGHFNQDKSRIFMQLACGKFHAGTKVQNRNFWILANIDLFDQTTNKIRRKSITSWIFT